MAEKSAKKTRMSILKWFGLLAVVIAVGLLAWKYVDLVPSDGPAQHGEKPESGTLNPRKGSVKVWKDDTLKKRCDGTTLIYRDLVNEKPTTMSVVPNSSECQS